MDIKEQLKDIGLHGSEIRVYLFLMQNGVSTPPQIALGTKIARPNTYRILRMLKEKGLILEEMRGKRQAYLASDPVAFVQGLERQKQLMDKLLPDLRALYTVQKNKPSFQFFDGFEQVKQIFSQSLDAKEILGIASTKKLFAHDPKFFEKYRIDLKKKGIVFRDILTYASGDESGPKAKEEMRGLYEMKLLPEKYKDVPSDILIWDDKVSITVTEEPIFGTILTNSNLAESFRIMFEVMWEGLA